MIDLTQFVEEYYMSGFRQMQPSETDNEEHACINRYLEFAAERQTAGPSTILAILESAFAAVNIPSGLKQRLPEILASFHDYLAETGKFPPAATTAVDLRMVSAAWSTRFRADGTIRGTTVINEGMQISRNDPCPCGSGKKFKKCCLSLIS